MSHREFESERRTRRLLEDAGARPGLPEQDLAEIRAAARREWETLVEPGAPGDRSRGPIRLFALAASLLLGLLLGWLGWQAISTPPRVTTVATLALVRGQVTIQPPPGDSTQLGLAPAPGQMITAGSIVETAPDSGAERARIALTLPAGQSIRLDGGSRVELISATELALERGALYFDSAAAPPDRAPVEILTGFGRVSDIGTQYEVRLRQGTKNGLELRVREGAAALTLADETHSARRGEELVLASDGTLARQPIATFGAAWAWVLEASPGIDIEGVSLRTFLAWTARESGKRVDYQTEDVKRLAEETLLYGPIDGLGPDEAALDALIEGSGLEYSNVDDRIVVSRPAAP